MIHTTEIMVSEYKIEDIHWFICSFSRDFKFSVRVIFMKFLGVLRLFQCIAERHTQKANFMMTQFLPLTHERYTDCALQACRIKVNNSRK